MEDYYLKQAKGIVASFIKGGLIKTKDSIRAESLLRVALEERFSSEKVIQNIVGIADLSIEKVFEGIEQVEVGEPLLGFAPTS